MARVGASVVLGAEASGNFDGLQLVVRGRCTRLGSDQQQDEVEIEQEECGDDGGESGTTSEAVSQHQQCGHHHPGDGSQKHVSAFPASH